MGLALVSSKQRQEAAILAPSEGVTRLTSTGFLLTSQRQQKMSFLHFCLFWGFLVFLFFLFFFLFYFFFIR